MERIHTIRLEDQGVERGKGRQIGHEKKQILKRENEEGKGRREVIVSLIQLVIHLSGQEIDVCSFSFLF